MPNTLFDTIIAQNHTKKKTVKQQRIIETAIKLFAEKGYSNTSTAEIAKAAEVSEGAIFKHYKTKEHLLLSLIIPSVKDFLPAVLEEVLKETLTEDTTTFEQFLRAFLKNRIGFISENREVFQVVIKEIIYKEELKKDILLYFPATVLPLLTNVIEEFKRRGELKAIPAEYILKSLCTFIGGFFISRFILMDNYTVSDEEIEHTVEFLMNGLNHYSRK